jgi:hypothetical protein
MADTSQPISELGEIQDVSASTWQLIRARYKWQAISTAIFTLILSVGLCWLMNDIRPIALALFVPFMTFSYLRQKVQGQFMQQFAKAKGLTYNPEGDFSTEIGSLFKRGDSRRLYNEISGSYKGYPLRLFNYTYGQGSGKSRQVFFYTVFDLEFSMDLPRLYLDAAIQQFWRDALVGSLDPLPLSSVEFEKKFKLYITRGSQITALQIFTPDLMAELLDLRAKFDIEIVGRQIYLYYPWPIDNVAALNDLYRAAELVITNLGAVAEKIRV